MEEPEKLQVAGKQGVIRVRDRAPAQGRYALPKLLALGIFFRFWEV
jgi:hypothetical protein